MKRRLYKSLKAVETAAQTPLPWARGARRNAMIARREIKLRDTEN